jgi:hypothetical protein
LIVATGRSSALKCLAVAQFPRDQNTDCAHDNKSYDNYPELSAAAQ